MFTGKILGKGRFSASPRDEIMQNVDGLSSSNINTGDFGESVVNINESLSDFDDDIMQIIDTIINDCIGIAREENIDITEEQAIQDTRDISLAMFDVSQTIVDTFDYIGIHYEDVYQDTEILDSISDILNTYRKQVSMVILEEYKKTEDS